MTWVCSPKVSGKRITCRKVFSLVLVLALTLSMGIARQAAAAEPRVVRAAVGLYHSLVVAGGVVWASGSNSYGQLGDGTKVARHTPVRVTDSDGDGYLSGVIAVAAGSYHSLALKSDGTVWAWGWNHYGQLGDGTTTERTTPVQVANLSNIVSVAAGGLHNLALEEDGTVWAWGLNLYGELGDGTWVDKYTPVKVRNEAGNGNLTDVLAISAGYTHSLALGNDGTVWAWGQNDAGQLGQGFAYGHLSLPKKVKVQVESQYQDLSGVTAISAGYRHSLVLKTDKTVCAWGSNSSGTLGDGTTADKSTPVQVKNEGGDGYLSDILAISAGYTHSLALKSGGTMWAWGDNSFGQLGDGTIVEHSPLPVPVSGLSGVTEIAEGQYAKHAWARKDDGSVWAWGMNWGGQLGNGTDTDSSVPVRALVPTAPSDANSGITGQLAGARGTKQVTLTVVVRDAESIPLRGYSAGDFSVKVDGTPTTFADEQCFSEFADNDDGTYTVVFTGEDDNTSYTLEDLTVSNVVIHSSSTVTTPPPVVYVCEIIDGAQYTTLGEALSSVPDEQGKTIRLLADIQLNSGIDIRKKDITFDLAGHKLDVVDTSSDGVGLFCGERHWVVPAVE